MTTAIMAQIGKFSICAVAAGIMLAVASLNPVAALDDPPKPKIDCTKKANKTNPKCQKSSRELSDDELYNAAYWLSRQGDYASSLALLRQVQNPDVPRVLNATGFATRKLGNVDAAMPYYSRALSLDPNFTRAREYLGEAYLSKGDVGAAKLQLKEIAERCGTSCSGYSELAGQIAAFEAVKTSPVAATDG